MNHPYIGITDIDSPEVAKELLDFFVASGGLDINRKLMVGPMSSYKVLNNIPNKWTDIFPKKERYHEIFLKHSAAFNTIHYADYDNNYLGPNLNKLVFYGGSNLHAIQLDMIWPDPKVLFKIKTLHPNYKFVLQVGQTAMDLLGNDKIKIINKLIKYRNVIDYVLLDCSMGSGKELIVDQLLGLIPLIDISLPIVNIAVAGGLGPDSIEVIRSLLKEYPDLSIDAQSKLRPSGSAKNPLNIEYCKKYIVESIKLIKEYQ